MARSSFASRASSGARWISSRTVRITLSAWRVLKNSITRSAASTSANSRSRSSTLAGGPSRRGALNGRASAPRASDSSYSVSTTACARLSEGYAGSLGIVTTRWHRSSASFESPLSSRPNSSATRPTSACARISAAAARGRCRFRLALRPRDVKPTTCTQSARACSSRSWHVTRARMSWVWCAMPSTRYASYSRGFTRRRSRNPKFFRARTTCAMLTRSWGSWSTTAIMTWARNRTNAECGIRNAEWQGKVRSSKLAAGLDGRAVHSAFRILHSALVSSHQLQDPHPLRILPVASQPHPSVSPAPDELPGAPHAVGEHLVNDKIEPHPASDVRPLPRGPRHGEGHAVAAFRTPPRAPHSRGGAGRFTRPAHAQRRAVPPFGHDEKPSGAPALGIAQVELHPVRVDVVGLVVEQQWRRARGPETEIGFRDLDGEVKRIVVPGDVGQAREVFGARVWLLAAAVLVLERQLERLARVEPVERTVERRRLAHPQRRAEGRRRPVELEQRRERRLGLARASQPHASPPRAGIDLPAGGGGGVTVDPLRRVHLDHPALRAHAAHGRRLADRLQRCHDPRTPPPLPHNVERRPLPGSGRSRPVRAQQLALEQQKRLEHAWAGGELQHDGPRALRDQPLHPRHPLVGQVTGRPRPPPHVPRPLKMPRQLDDALSAARELDHVEHVPRTRYDGARHVPVAAPGPGPVTSRVERFARRVALLLPERLGRAVQPGRVVGQRRAVPKEIARHVGPRARIGEPMHPIGVEREVQAGGMAVPAPQGTALEAHVARPSGGAQHGEPDRLHLTLHADGVHWLADAGA